MIAFAHAPQFGEPLHPGTWGRGAPAWQARHPGDICVVTCTNGHQTRLVSAIHSVAADGTVSPSYVCVADGCSFHEFVRLEGWPG